VIDTLLVLVSLVGVGQITVPATLTADSALVLDAPPVFALLGLGTPAAPTVALDELRRRYPSATFAWLPRELAVVIDDPRLVIPASAAARSAIERVARGAFTAISGPFAAATADDRSRTLLEAGYAWRGRIALSARRSSSAPLTTWAATVAPAPALVASVSGDRAITGATARLAVGHAWLLSTWTPQGLSADALVALPHVALFASSRQSYLVTITAQAAGLQFGRAAGHTVARVSIGPIPPSPFVLPQP
jgi:hypothetical protein